MLYYNHSKGETEVSGLEGCDVRLEDLRREMAEKAHLESVLGALDGQLAALEKKVWNLEYDAKREQGDVDRLEGRSLTAWIQRILGKYEQNLQVQQAEAAAAALKWESAKAELEAVRARAESVRKRLQDLRGSEQEYARLLRRKREAIEASGSPSGREIVRLQEEIVGLDARERELTEAIRAGREAVSTADGVLECLDRAAKWSTADAFGIDLADFPKYAALEDAHSRTLELQIRLNAFRSELADVELDEELQVQMEGLLKFADFFFDGLLADLAVRDRIDRARTSVGRAKDRVGALLGRLESEIGANRRDRADKLDRIEKIVLETNGQE